MLARLTAFKAAVFINIIPVIPLIAGIVLREISFTFSDAYAILK
jgi:hypothetical protein